MPITTVRVLSVLLPLVGTVGLTSCGGSSPPSATDRGSSATAAGDHRVLPPEPQGQEPNKGTPGVQDYSGGKIDVPIRFGRFTPHRMTLRVGQIVVFTNDDDQVHAVRAVGRRQPRSGAIPVGGRYEFEPLRPGRIRYSCPIHPAMTGTLVVLAR